METRIIYDTYIQNDTMDTNYGSKASLVTKLEGANYLAYILLYSDIEMESLKELKLKTYKNDHSCMLDKYTSSNSKESVFPTNLNIKLDLYALQEKFSEKKVTWDTAPKTELIARDIITFVSNNAPSYFEIDLLPYVEQIKYGIMLKINNYILTDFANKYNTNNATYPYFIFRFCKLDLLSSESTNQPVLFYNYGTKPSQPKIMSPMWGTIINKKTTSSIQFDWESAAQTDYIFEYSQDGQNWTSKTGTAVKYYNLSTDGLENGNLYVKVKIKADNIWSDYSQTWFLQIGEKPNTPIISLTGATTSTPKINWDTNSLQYMYQVQVLQDDTIIEGSGELKGNITNYNLKTRLESGKSYTFKVRIADKYEIWSDWATNTTLISFAKPPKPVITLYPQPNRGSILVSIENPEPGTEEEIVVYNEIFRKEENKEWIRIASNVSEKYIDYTTKSEMEYQYKVRAIGQNGYNDSNIKIADVKVQYSDIAIVGDWNRYIKLRYNDTKRQNAGYSGEILRFAGRDKPVVEFEDTYDSDIALNFELTSKEELNTLQEMINSRRTLLYRDSKGRKMYGNVISRLDVEDLKFNHFKVSFTFTEIDYSEVI